MKCFFIPCWDYEESIFSLAFSLHVYVCIVYIFVCVCMCMCGVFLHHSSTLFFELGSQSIQEFNDMPHLSI